VIFCVVPEALAPELFDKLVEHYADDPNVKVIVDRRKGDRRSAGGTSPDGQRRELRDRRRRGVPGEFPPLDPGS
jgi:hypothetical protein